MGNFIDILGSFIDNEREVDLEKEIIDKFKKNKMSWKVIDEYKDEELEILCEILDMLINDISSDFFFES